MSKTRAGCNLHGDNLPREAFDETLVCKHCRGRIPPSAALTFDGTDYVWHFCGHDCLAGWCESVLGRRH